MKRLFLGLTFLLFALVSAQQNLVPNGNFETFRNNRFTGWFWADPQYFERSTDAHSGRYSQKVWANGTSFATIKNGEYNAIDIEAGAEYDFSYWYKGTTQKNVVVVVYWYKDDERVKTESFDNEQVSPTSVWQEKKLKLTAPIGVNKVGFSFRILLTNDGYIQIDDVSLVFNKSGDTQTLPVPTKFERTAYQREIELSWDKEADPEIAWEVVVDNQNPIKTQNNAYIIENLEPNTTHKVKIRAVKGSIYSEYTPEYTIKTNELGYAKEDLDRVPYLRTIANDMRCQKNLRLYYTDLADKNAKIKYYINDIETSPNGNILIFPKTGKQKLRVLVEESQELQWDIDYIVDVQ